MVRGLCLGALMGLTGCMVGGGTQEWNLEGVQRLEVLHGAGDLHIQSTLDAAEGTWVFWDGGGIGNDNVRPEVWVEDGIGYVDANGGPLGGGDLDIHTPLGVDLVVKLERGDAALWLQAPANIDACVAAGALSIGVPAGVYDLELDGAAGALNSTGLQHDPDAEHGIRACVAAGELEVYDIESHPDHQLTFAEDGR